MFIIGYIRVKNNYWDELLNLKEYLSAHVTEEGQFSFAGLPYYDIIFDSSDIPQDIQNVSIEDRIAAFRWGQKVLSCKVFVYNDMLCIVNPQAVLYDYVDKLVVFPTDPSLFKDFDSLSEFPAFKAIYQKVNDKKKAYQLFLQEQNALIAESSIAFQADDSVVKQFVKACHAAAHAEQSKRQEKLCQDILGLTSALAQIKEA